MDTNLQCILISVHCEIAYQIYLMCLLEHEILKMKCSFQIIICDVLLLSELATSNLMTIITVFFWGKKVTSKRKQSSILETIFLTHIVDLVLTNSIYSVSDAAAAVST